ncbi:hypothetical protein ACFWOJ_25590 [Streptomyces sp. NPDC058439]|uniref:hypothetical protein n=1 Tax=Streptomyces sp. NPDC058439 TaxID=3346500 RepID=UPI00364B0396
MVTETVLIEQYWQEIHSTSARAGIPVHHFLLDTDRYTLEERIHTDTEPESIDARRRRLDHLADYR